MLKSIASSLAILFIALAMTGCAGMDLMPQKSAMIPAGGGHEDCVQLETTHTMKLYFESTVPVKFNIHCHKDGEKVAHNEKEVTKWEGEFKPEWGEYYCLQFQNNSASMADVTYGFKVVNNK